MHTLIDKYKYSLLQTLWELNNLKSDLTQRATGATEGQMKSHRSCGMSSFIFPKSVRALRSSGVGIGQQLWQILPFLLSSLWHSEIKVCARVHAIITLVHFSKFKPYTLGRFDRLRLLPFIHILCVLYWTEGKQHQNLARPRLNFVNILIQTIIDT